MKALSNIPAKIYTLEGLQRKINQLRLLGKKIGFTNGVFDILHEGHLASLSEAAGMADFLIVAVNADTSVKRLKGETRPIQNEQSRALLLASLLLVDAVIIFEDDTPGEIIKTILPDVLVKGGDYTVDQIAGAKEVLANGGQVHLARIIPGISTTGIIARMKELKGG